MFPRLPICLLADSLYANESVFSICKKNSWEYLLRYKDGSLPKLAREYDELKDMGDNEEETVSIEEIHKRKPSALAKHRMKWVNGLSYNGHIVTVLELEIEKNDNPWKEFQWITSFTVSANTAYKFAETGRKRWLIENEGFNIQKNHRYFITHANSLDYNAMKNHYLLTQLADMLVQMYEFGTEDLRIIKRTLQDIADGLLYSLQKQPLDDNDIIFDTR